MGTRGTGRCGPDRGGERQLEVEQAHDGAARARLLVVGQPRDLLESCEPSVVAHLLSSK